MGLGACSEEHNDPIRVGTNVWPGYEPGYLALDLGYLTEKEVKLNQFQSATETIRAFRNGAIDVVALTLDEALLLIQDGMDIKIFLVTDISDGGDVIMSRPDITSAAQLDGKLVGVESSALGAYVLARALEIHNVPFENVTTVHMTIDESERAYQEGIVDAIVTFEPYRSRLIRDGAKEIFSSREMPNEIVDVLVTRTDYAEKNGEAISAFTKAWLMAVEFIVDQPDKASVLIGQRLRLTKEEASSSFDGLVLPNTEMNINLLSRGTPINLADNAVKLGNVLVEHGLLRSQVNMENIFTDQYVRNNIH
jgi:NitT/TauT family transport system substrate-binding protein